MAEEREAVGETENGDLDDEIGDKSTVLDQIEKNQSENSDDNSSSSKGLGFSKVFKNMIIQIFHPSEENESLLPFERVKTSFSKHASLLQDSAKHSFQDLLVWTSAGGAWRPFLVISVGTILLLALTGLGALMLFFLALTMNAVIISLLMSIAAVGSFMAIFFTCVAAIFIGALALAALVISVSTLAAISAVAVVAGWIGILWLAWKGIWKAADITKKSLTLTVSYLAAATSNGPIQKLSFIIK